MTYYYQNIGSGSDLNSLLTNGVYNKMLVIGNFYNGASNIPDNYGLYVSYQYDTVGIQIAIGTQTVSYAKQKAFMRMKYSNSIEGWHQLD